MTEYPSALAAENAALRRAVNELRGMRDTLQTEVALLHTHLVAAAVECRRLVDSSMAAEREVTRLRGSLRTVPEAE